MLCFGRSTIDETFEMFHINQQIVRCEVVYGEADLRDYLSYFQPKLMN
jgi:hypothetical protein